MFRLFQGDAGAVDTTELYGHVDQFLQYGFRLFGKEARQAAVRHRLAITLTSFGARKEEPAPVNKSRSTNPLSKWSSSMAFSKRQYPILLPANTLPISEARRSSSESQKAGRCASVDNAPGYTFSHQRHNVSAS